MIIRQARENDYDALARIWVQGSVLPEAGIFEAPAGLLEELRERLPREINSGWSAFVAERDGEVVGLLAFDKRERSLNELFVEAKSRSTGVGKALLDFAKREMPDGFWLRTRIENVRAQKFYVREGLIHTHDAPHPRHPEAMFRHYTWKA